MRVRFDRMFECKPARRCSTGCRRACPGGRRPHHASPERPEIRLQSDGSENGIRACATKREISGHITSEAGCIARDIMLGPIETGGKLGVSVFRCRCDRLGMPDGDTTPALPDLVGQVLAPCNSGLRATEYRANHTISFLRADI